MKELEKEILQFINELSPLNFINIKPITNEMY
ncbi:protein kinase, partial [Bacillus anthracis]|nr:protein kinase [Bacillus anthracis]